MECTWIDFSQANKSLRKATYEFVCSSILTIHQYTCRFAQIDWIALTSWILHYTELWHYSANYQCDNFAHYLDTSNSVYLFVTCINLPSSILCNVSFTCFEALMHDFTDHLMMNKKDPWKLSLQQVRSLKTHRISRSSQILSRNDQRS